MTDYKQLYARMVGASERAIEEIERQNYGMAKEILISAEQDCEERFLSVPQDEK